MTDIRVPPRGFALSNHVHNAGEINAGILPVARGGTGKNVLPKFAVHKNSASQSNLQSGVFNLVTWPYVQTDSNLSFANNTYTAKSAGTLFFAVTIMLVTGLQDQRQMILSLYKNGGRYRETRLHTSGTDYQNIPTLVLNDEANLNDYYQVYVYNGCSVPVGIFGGPEATYWTGAIFP